MLCQQCQQRPASVHVTQIINNEKREMHLCEQCANQQQQMVNFISPFSINDFLTAFLGNNYMYSSSLKPQGKPSVCEMPVCNQCGMTYERFSKIGKLGCQNCYHVFHNILDQVLRKIHGNVFHKGKLPNRTGGDIKIKKEIEQLKSKLNQAIQAEEYEKAAMLRDQIRQLEGTMKGE